MRVNIDDIRKAGYCVRGAKAWFEAKGLDFRDFMKNGMAAEEWSALGDAHADRVLRCKTERGETE